MDNDILKEKLKPGLMMLFNELDGKVMDYESCRIMEEGIYDLIDGMIKEMEKGMKQVAELVEQKTLAKVKDKIITWYQEQSILYLGKKDSICEISRGTIEKLIKEIEGLK